MFWENAPGDLDNNEFLVEDGTSYTYKEVFDVGDRIFKGNEQCVCLIECQRNLQTVAFYLGCLRQGIVPLLLDPGIKVNQLLHYSEQYKAEIIFTFRKIDDVNYSFDSKFENLNCYRRREDKQPIFHKNLKLLLPTSGSTGDPKCVRLSDTNINTCSNEIANYLNMNNERISISSLPFQYSYGLSILHSTIAARAKIILCERSILENQFWLAVETNNVTDFAGVPFMFDVLRRKPFTDKVLSNLVCVTQAGGRLEPSSTEYFARFFQTNRVNYFTMYGQTEASPRISYVPPEMALRKLGSVGIPIGCGSFSTDSVDGLSEGELIYNGPNVCMGYASSREDLRRGDENNGILKTGDLAIIDNDGYATLVGRLKRQIKLYGNTVNLDYIELTLRQQNYKVVVLGKDDKITILTTFDDKDQITNFIKTEMSIQTRGLRVLKIDCFARLQNSKIDYVYLSKEYL